MRVTDSKEINQIHISHMIIYLNTNKSNISKKIKIMCLLLSKTLDGLL